jgi:hypothetical protein
MRIIYNDKSIEQDVKAIAKELNANIEHKKNLSEEIENFKKSYKGPPIGSPVPSDFIDLGRYLVTFFLGNIAYDVIKVVVLKWVYVLKNKVKNKYDSFIISDGENPEDYKNNTYFFIPIDINEDELVRILDKIEKIMNIVNNLKKEAKISGSLRFSYSSGEFIGDIIRDMF